MHDKERLKVNMFQKFAANINSLYLLFIPKSEDFH